MSRVGNCLYNLDRAVASLCGAPAQETISSEVGRVSRDEAFGHNRFEQWAAIRLAMWLDKGSRLWGQDHTKKSIEHADKLDKVDDGTEQ